jgi:hypothetical protein
LKAARQRVINHNNLVLLAIRTSTRCEPINPASPVTKPA